MLADDGASVDAIRKILRVLGHEVNVVADGTEALAALQQAGTTWSSSTSRCRAGGPRGGQPASPRPAAACPYLIAISADDSPGERARCLEAGIDEFLAKPVLAAVLAERAGRIAMAAAGLTA